MRNHYNLGKLGECAVAALLARRKFTIVYRNYRRKATELDIVAKKNDDLLIVEVKTRSKSVDDYASLITPAKIRALQQGANRLLLDHAEWSHCYVHLGLAVVVLTVNSPQTVQWFRLSLDD